MNSFAQIFNLLPRWKRHLPVINLSLLVVICLLLIGAAISALSANKVDEISRPAKDSASPLAFNIGALHFPKKKAADFQLIGKKNIFAADRIDWRKKTRLAADDAKPVNILSPLIKQLKVQGVFRIGGKWMALVNNLEFKKSHQKVMSVRRGDSLLGCTVSGIDENGLKLECHGKLISKTINNHKNYSYIFRNDQEETPITSGKKDEYIGKPSVAGRPPSTKKKNTGLDLFDTKTGKKSNNPMGTITHLLELMKSIEK